MPVLSDQPHHGLADLPGSRTSYFFLGALVLLLAGIFISRRKRLSTGAHTGPHSMSFHADNLPEKEAVVATNIPTSTSNSIGISETPSASLAKPRIGGPRPAAGQPPPFAPPFPSSPTFDSESNSWTFDSYEPVLEMGMPPRRRSYTKNTPDGGEVSGEIVVAEGWRRHTRVFGGGVCKACEESERKMSA
jgi:hypothetical protein